MKSLNNYISESIYGNLGIGPDALAKEWVEKYNKQLGSNQLKIGDDGKIYNAHLEPIVDLYLISNSILDNGALPVYLNFSANASLNVYIEAPGFKSFDNFPEVKHLDIRRLRQSVDFSSLTCCEYVSIVFKGCSLVIRNIKPTIVSISDTEPMSYRKSGDSGSVWKNIRGCTFGKYHNVKPDWTIIPRIEITNLIDNKNNVDALNAFFKNNKFDNDSIDIICNVALNNLTFLDDADCKFNKISLDAPDDLTKDELTDYFNPLINNADKLKQISIRGKQAKVAVNNILRKALPNKIISYILPEKHLS